MIPVIIPYFKAKDKLDKCIAAVKAQKGVETTLVIRDNSEDNILYTRAINECLKKWAFKEKIEFALILTQDAYMMGDQCLSSLIDAMRSDPRAGIVSPLQFSGDRITWGGSLEAWPSGRHAHPGPVTVPHRTYWANGACMLFRTEMIKEIGLMDPALRFICSDSDYSFTARIRGWDVLVQPRAHVEHELDGSGSFGKNPWLDIIKLEDLIHFTNKWLSGGVYKQLSLEGPKITPKIIRAQIYQWENLRKKLMAENPGLSPLSLGAG